LNFYREGKLAETAPKRPLALTIGAAAVTLLVVLGVLSGPSIVTCFNSPEGMGQCLRGKMVEVGLIPAPPTPAIAETEAPAEEVVASVEEAVPAEPELDVTPPAELEAEPAAEADVDQVVAATFGLLRAEPDGSVVIAGSGTPGSRVEVFANGELLGTVEVESSGDWVFVPDAPLPPGGLEITLGEEGKPGTAEDAFIVVIDEDKTSQPLVVASTPGEASEVLQGLTDPVQIAQAPESTQEPATAEASVSAEAPEAAEAGELAGAVEPTVESEASGAEPIGQVDAPEPTAPESDPVVPEPLREADQSVDEPAMDIAALPDPVEPEASTDAEPPPATPESVPTQEAPATQEAAVAVDAAEPAADTDTAEQAVEPSVASEVATEDTVDAAEAPVAVADEPIVDDTPVEELAPVQTAVVPPTIDAIELENDRTFFAGAGPDGGIIRLYVDDSFVADVTVEGGRWLVEAGPVLDSSSQRVRVDLLQPGSAEVVARAEVDFVVDVPGAEVPIDVAEAPASAPTVSEPAPAPEATAPASTPLPAEAPAEPQTSTAEQPVVEAEVAAAEEATPQLADAPDTSATEPEQTPDVPDQQVAVSEQAEPVSTEPVTPSPATDAPTAEQPQQAPAEPVETPAETVSDEPAVPTMVAVSLGDPEAQRFASGKAIIRRGDNLWTIARRVYGEGLKYTTIYQANTGQIRDPDRIYPGQVFDLPEDALGQ
jgi:nucleoid-associated protein YgaU